MKLTLLLLIPLLQFGDQNHDLKLDKFVGVYKIFKSKKIEESANGWSYFKRYERTLILHPDHTYDEINLSFEAFDYMDEYGTWKITNEQLLLTPIGNLDYIRDTYERIKNQEKTLKGNRILEIVSPKELKILDDGFLNNEILVKQDSVKSKV